MFRSFARELNKLAQLSREQIHSYYAAPETQERLVPQLQGKNVFVRLGLDGRKTIKRKHQEKNIQILTAQGQSPDSYRYWIERRANELLPEYGKKTDHLLIDIDPGKDVDFARTKAITAMAQKQMANAPGVKEVSVNFTGGRGFHVRGHLQRPLNINKARRLSATVAQGVPSVETTLGKRKTEKEIRLDVTPLKRRGVVRPVYSLNEDTGLVAAPVKNLKTFQPQDATPEKVLSGGLKQIEPERPFGGLEKAIREAAQKYKPSKARGTVGEPLHVKYGPDVHYGVGQHGTHIGVRTSKGDTAHLYRRRIYTGSAKKGIEFKLAPDEQKRADKIIRELRKT